MVSLNLSEIAAFKAELKDLLEQLRAEAGEEYSEQTKQQDLHVHDSGEEAEAVVDLMMHVENLARHDEEIADCLAALKRIDEGDFGFCLDCGEEIELSRLRACPTASRCIRCQSVLEAEVRKTA
ncbi:TraR/DksA family transcriptional regulator [Neptuniibacter caesariensis]|uniref:Zn-finger, prokaryotic DksA/TraR C4 type n=1 Tax=Neptuniibacter caesariensis TaxID=207954 RepID=A0A7U8GRD5_NEPCE|nr:TraR/DksA family transcriptional regulator [Neptuniibacter caesariensis]EAR60133.1 Zn-finger, prokaryotic DksA/TraR C4 type [Oceanospirillum sp. MED92] [Neptuniibacter caesariensis]